MCLFSIFLFNDNVLKKETEKLLAINRNHFLYQKVVVYFFDFF